MELHVQHGGTQGESELIFSDRLSGELHPSLIPDQAAICHREGDRGRLAAGEGAGVLVQLGLIDRVGFPFHGRSRDRQAKGQVQHARDRHVGRRTAQVGQADSAQPLLGEHHEPGLLPLVGASMLHQLHPVEVRPHEEAVAVEDTGLRLHVGGHHRFDRLR